MTEATEAIRRTNSPVVLNSGVAIRGAELVPEKLLAIIDYHLTHIQKEAGVLAITFRNDNRPTNKLGTAHEWSYSAAINLQRIFDLTWEKLSEQEWGLNLRDAVWLGLLETVIHEVTHIHTAFQDEAAHEELIMKGTDDDRADHEELTKEVAREFMMSLFKKVNCEAPSIENMGFLGGLLHEIFVKEAGHSFIQRSKIMLEQEMCYQDVEGDDKVYYKTLRDYVRNSLFKDSDFGDDDVNLIQVTFHMENGDVVADAEPVVDAEEAMVAPQVQAAVAQVLTETYGEDVEEADAADTAAVLAVLGTQDGVAVIPDVPDETIILPAPETTVEAQPTAAAAAPAQPVLQPDAVVMPNGEEFELPAHIVQATAQTATAPEETPMPKALPALNLDMEKVKGCLQEIYLRLYNHTFLKCGWSLNQESGRYGFKDPNAVLFSVSVADILTRWGCEGLIHEYSGYPEGAQITAQTKPSMRYDATAGHLQGILYSGNTLPAFEFFLNIEGQAVQRRLVPQNPAKMTNNAYTKGADFAAAGNATMYVFTDASNDRPWHERCKAKIVNKVYEEQVAS